MTAPFLLKDKIAIVTGAGKGVGRSIARILAGSGATIVCSGRTLDTLNDAVAEIHQAGGKATAIVADVLKAADLRALVTRTMAQYGRIDILVNNAGGGGFKPFLETTEEEFRHHFDWNTTSAFVLSQLVAPHMIARGSGAILNLSSSAARLGIRSMIPYCVAKAALEQLTRALAQELGPKIRVNCIQIGVVTSPGLQNTFDTIEGFRARMLDNIPLRKIGDPDEIGLAALYLCSSAASNITGTILNIDGGIQNVESLSRLPDL
jgi:NAD(P)-dependent dehydrogenase (short-subunit alcohol dehydrogenase family)